MQHTQPQHTYYLQARPIVYAAILLIALWVGWIALREASALDWSDFLYIGVACLWLVGYQTRIVTSPAGISFHNPGLYALHSTWEDLARFEEISVGLSGSQCCLVLKQGVVLGWWTSLAWGISGADRGRCIPLTWGWANFDQLLADIKTYAPQLAGLTKHLAYR